MEDIESDADNGYNRKLIILPKDEGRNEIVERLDKAYSQGLLKMAYGQRPGFQC